MPMDRNRYSSYINAPKSMMGGPSMDTAGLAMSLAQQLMGSSPAMGGIGASAGAMGGLSGPAMMALSIPSRIAAGITKTGHDVLGAFSGMPNPLRKDPMSDINKMLQQYFDNSNNVPALSTGTIGTQNNITPDMDEQTFSMPKMSSEEPAGAPSAGNVYRLTGDEMPIDLTRDDRDYSNDPDALAISGGRIAGLDRRSRSNDFSREPEPYKIGSGLGTVARGFSGALGGLKGPADDGSLAAALKSAAANYPTERATGRMSSGAFVGGPVSPPSMGGSPSAASMMGQRPQPQPKLMGQDYQLGDYTLPQRRRTTGYSGTGGGF